MTGTARKLLVSSAALFALAALAPRSAAAQGKVYTAAELTTPASLKSTSAAAHTIERNYPTALKRIGGKVQLRFVVLPDGSVDPGSVKVMVATVSALGEAATKAITEIRFNPGEVNGKPVAALVIFPVTYAAR